MNTIPLINQTFTKAQSDTIPMGALVTKQELQKALAIATKNGKVTVGERVAIEKGWESLFDKTDLVNDRATLGAQQEYVRVQKALGLRPHKLTAEAVAQTADGRVAIKAALTAAVKKLNASGNGTFELVLPKAFDTRWTIRQRGQYEIETYYTVMGHALQITSSETTLGNEDYRDIATATPKGLAAVFKKVAG